MNIFYSFSIMKSMIEGIGEIKFNYMPHKKILNLARRLRGVSRSGWVQGRSHYFISFLSDSFKFRLKNFDSYST
jgi:hypothetical protein